MNHVLIKIRNSLSKISLHKRIKALWLAGRNSFGHIFTFPQGWGLQSSVSSDGKISSHLTVHSHFTAPKPRCPQVRGGEFPITAPRGDIFLVKKIGLIGWSTPREGRTMPNRWRSHQYVAIVVRMMPRSKNSENLTNTTEPKPTSWKGGMIRRRKPSNRSIDRVPKLQGTQISRKICVSIIDLVKRGATIAHLKIKERTPLPSHKVMFKKKEGRYRNVLVSFSAWYSEKTLFVWSLFGNCAEPIPFGVRLGLLAVRACGGWHPSSMVVIEKGGMQQTECISCKICSASLLVGMNQVCEEVV